MTAASLRAVLRAYRRSEWQADLVLLTGDLVQDDSPGAYRRLRKMLLKLGLPIYLTPGNHDVPELMAEHLAGQPFETCPTTVIGGWQLIGLSTFVEGSAGGRISEADLQRLASTLSGNPDTPTLVYLHHPPLDLGSAWLDSVGLSNKLEFFDVLRQSGNVRCILFGHAHQEVDENVDGIRVLGTPSTCAQFRPKSDKFAVDDLPPAYRELTLNADGQISTSVQWIQHD